MQYSYKSTNITLDHMDLWHVGTKHTILLEGIHISMLDIEPAFMVGRVRRGGADRGC